MAKSKTIKLNPVNVSTAGNSNTFIVPSVGETLEIRVVPLSSISIGDYQRTEVYNNSSITLMANNYCAQTASLIAVTPNSEGGWNAVDGGRRLSALHKKFPSHLDAAGDPVMVAVQVFRIRNKSKEPLLLIKLNENTKKFNSNNAFKARLEAKEPEEVFIVETLKKISVNLVFRSGLCPANVSNSAGVFRRCLMRLGKAKFSKMVDILDTYRRPDPLIYPLERDALRPDFLLGLSRLINSTKWNMQKVADGLSSGLSSVDIFSVSTRMAVGESSEVKLFRAFEHSVAVGLAK